ncbi:D-3-phosphoglycerate dehydrogenase-like [Actinia tenebrosa]|uniref:D-3-phosphoglycerate dehydrogenase n=1 Tax=Actinia tenebrosa TaxID=6105 RepID=A0A6P8IZV0_ACTTE|nr:D-3-phosphoglycerate dehydrogenase-like [Actinia tenebrosa]
MMAGSLDLKRVLLCDNVDSCCKDILEANGIAVDVKNKLTKEELLAEITNYDGIVVRSATKVTEDVIRAGKKLKIIGRAGTGVDNIDIPSASLNGVLVMNTPGGNTLSAAEQTCTLICCLSRHIAQAAASMKEGKWDRKKFMGNELFDKTLGIIGLGRIGREVALRMQSFGMKTIGYDPLVSAADATEFNTEWMEPDQIWPKADYITVHVPLIPPTTGMLNDKTISMCKKGVYLLNVARGGIIDEEALLRGLESGHVGGAGLDVFVTEPPTGASAQLVQHPKVVACPHLGANTVEAQKRVAKEMAEQFVDAAKGKSTFGLVNVPFDLCEALKPSSLVSLGQTIGKVAVNLAGGKVTKVTVSTEGSEMKAHRYLTAAVCIGILSKPEVNLVNAAALAKVAGIEVRSSHTAQSNPHYPKTLSVMVQHSAGEVTLLASMIGQNTPALIQYGKHSFSSPVPLSDHLLVFKSKLDPVEVLSKLLPVLQSSGCKVKGFFTAAGSGTDECIGVVSTSSAVGLDKDLGENVIVYPQLSF